MTHDRLRTLSRSAALSASILATGCLAPRPAVAQESLTEAFGRGKALYDRGKFAEAAPYFERTAALAERAYGPADPDTARLLLFLGTCRLQTYRPAEAAETLGRAAAVFQRVGRAGEEAMCRRRLGTAYGRMGRLRDARAAFESSLRAAERSGETVEPINTRIEYGYMLQAVGRNREAGVQFEAAAAAAGRGDWPDAALQYGMAAHGMGLTLTQEGRADEAAPWLKRAEAVWKDLLSPDDRRSVFTRSTLALADVAAGRDAAAAPVFAAGERALLDQWGGDHVEVAQQRDNLGLLTARRGEAATSLEKLTAARRTYVRHARQVLPVLPRARQLEFLTHNRELFQAALAAAYTLRDRPGVAEASLEWVLNEKGLAREVLAEQELLTRNAGLDPRLKAAADRLGEVRRELAAAGDAPDRADEADRLRKEEAALVAQVGLAQIAAGDADRWTTVAQVAAALPPGAVLVEVVRLDTPTPPLSEFLPPPTNPEPARYLAWTLDGRGRVTLEDLGPAAAIDDLVTAVRRRMDGAGRDLDFDPDRAVEVAQDDLRALGDAVLAPLWPTLNAAGSWVVCPDGALWLAPWAALVAPDGRYAVEHAAIRHVVTGRELAAGPAGGGRSAGAYAAVFAAPDYNLDADAADRIATALKLTTDQRSRFRGASGDVGGVPRNFGPLPETAREGAAVAEPVSRFAGGRTYSYTGKDALESVFKKIPRPAAVVFATHGYFLPDDPAGANGDGVPADPLARCGLALAGANRRRGDRVDDGVLTGLEVLQADLRGTRLVVLSACETGVGTLADGEGVAGLRQAFRLAGAAGVVATLWKVPDADTADLMTDFWRRLAAGDPPEQALRAAQRAVLSSPGSAHPVFWAGPTLTGVDAPPPVRQ